MIETHSTTVIMVIDKNSATVSKVIATHSATLNNVMEIHYAALSKVIETHCDNVINLIETHSDTVSKLMVNIVIISNVSKIINLFMPILTFCCTLITTYHCVNVKVLHFRLPNIVQNVVYLGGSSERLERV